MSRQDGGSMSLFEVLTSASSHAHVARSLLFKTEAAPFLRGVVRIEEENSGWWRPVRFGESQERALSSCLAWHPGLFRTMARTTSGGCVRFATDGHEVALAVRIDDEPQGTAAILAPLDRGRRYPHDGFSIVVDGQAFGCSMPGRLSRPLPWIEGATRLSIVSLSTEAKEEGVSRTMSIPGLGARHEVCIWLPNLRGCSIREIWTDGTYVEQLPERGRMLVIGDAAGQGFCAEDSLLAWPTLVAEGLSLDIVNQSIAKQVYQPSMLMGGPVSNVRLVMLQLGGGYREEHCSLLQIKRDVRAFLRDVAELYDESKIVAITPFGTSDTISSTIRSVARAYGIDVIDGASLAAEGESVYAHEGYLSPVGHVQVASRLITLLLEKGG